MTISHILREDPELAEALASGDRERATELCVARTVRVERGRWRAGALDAMPGGIGLLLLEGVLLLRVGIDGRFGAELLGDGDLLRPWPGDNSAPSMSRATGWRVLEPLRVALLDAQAARRMAAYPELTGRLVGRALDRSRNLAVNLAIVHQARVGVRLRMLFWHLADRWGRVSSDGVILPLRLTHAVLADLVAARRPTVTSALTDLGREGLVTPSKSGWLLSGNPPGELLAARARHS